MKTLRLEVRAKGYFRGGSLPKNLPASLAPRKVEDGARRSKLYTKFYQRESTVLLCKSREMSTHSSSSTPKSSRLDTDWV